MGVGRGGRAGAPAPHAAKRARSKGVSRGPAARKAPKAKAFTWLPATRGSALPEEERKRMREVLQKPRKKAAQPTPTPSGATTTPQPQQQQRPQSPDEQQPQPQPQPQSQAEELARRSHHRVNHGTLLAEVPDGWYSYPEIRY